MRVLANASGSSGPPRWPETAPGGGGLPVAASLKAWCEGELSPYKIPKQLKVVDELPRNAMGKVTKPSLKTLF